METVELLTTRRRAITRAEFNQMSEIFAGERVELIRGWVIEMAPMKSLHQWASTKLTRLLVETLGRRAEVRAQLPFAASDDSEPEPDFAVVREIRTDATPSQALLIIEVADSTLRYDQTIKADLYAESNVPEYWVVDLNARFVEVRTAPAQGKYTRLETVSVDGSIRPLSFPDSEIRVSEFMPPES